jgi:predicted ATPase/signal transduction histidine kinase
MDSITQLLGYRIIEQLYAGSRTLVYRGVRESDSSAERLGQRYPVVIKLLLNPFPSFSELVQFRNQYTLTKNLDLPSIVKPLTLEPYKNAYALVMEDFGGISLKEMLKREGSMGQSLVTLSTFLQIGMQVADALDGLYRYRVIHKDLKPANIVIHPDSKQVKLIDFSIASLLPRETQEIQNANMLEGTLAYLSPEQTGRMNRGIDYRSDFYALGVTFYELLTGQLPFISNDPMELVHCHLAKHPATVNQLQPNVPLVVSEIVKKLMAKNAEDRYQSALGLKHDLERCLQHLKETGRIQLFELGTRDLCDRFLIPEKLYGRQAEVEALLNAFERVSIGKTEIVLVAGFSGIGKTVVVNEVHKPIVRQRGYFIKGKYDQFQRNIPFSAFVQAFRDLIGQLLAESDDQIQTWKTQILSAVGENGQVLIDVIPELEHIIGKQLPPAELSGSAAQNRFNLLMQKFMQVFTTADHPLVLFLDDLQWADSASLKLLELLMQNTGYLLVIGAYRDNEVSPVHPLMLMVDEIGKTGISIQTITLQPLSLVDMNQLIADTLNCSHLLAQPLTELIYQKTKGNPFFATQFLKSLHEDEKITFNWDVGYWLCDISQIEALGTTDVLEFIVLQLQKLPTQTQDVLKLAASIGSQFDLNTLAIISEQSKEDTAAALWKALEEGLIIPTTENYKFFSQSDIAAVSYVAANPIYRFLHDRVQQAAYSLIPTNQKQETHLHIGQLLLQVEEKSLEANIFEIVNHLNLGISLINQPLERAELASLNLIAGQKAKNAIAYEPSLGYFKTGLDLLVPECWQVQYDLTLRLHEQAGEVAYLLGHFESMQQFIQALFKNTRDSLDKITSYQIQIQGYAAQGRNEEVMQTALSVLQNLGIELPAQPSQQDIQKKLEQVALYLSEKHIEDLVNLDKMTDPKSLAIMQILSAIIPVVFNSFPQLLPFVVLTMVDLSIRFGNATISPFAYALYGVILCGALGDIDTGSQFGQLAINLLYHGNNREAKSSTLFVVNCIIKHWQQPITETFSFLQEAYYAGLECGDLEHAAWSIALLSFNKYLAGTPLEELEKEMAVRHQLVHQTHQERPAYSHGICYQAVLNLISNTTSPCWMGQHYDETVMLAIHVRNHDLYTLCHLYTNKLMLSVLFQDYQKAKENAQKAEEHLDGAVGMPLVPLVNFYGSLAQLANYANASSVEQSAILEKVAANQHQMELWASQAPVNYLHKFHLVEAQQQHILGNKALAINLYDCAIATAKANGYIQEEALANELAAKFYLEWGKEAIAQTYLISAYYAYSHWGAKAKVDDLEQRYPQLLAPILQRMQPSLIATETILTLSHQSKTSASSSASEGLDLATILKASQALSGEIELEKLLSVLLHVVLENAGADICALLMPKNEQWVIEAFSQLGQPSVILQSLSLEDSQVLPVSLINKVKHTLQPLIVENLATNPSLAADPYIQRQCPKSILCTPILHSGKLIGILYLENNLTIGAFTSDRIKLLSLICAQAAISLENARLYQQSQQSLTDLKQAQLQIVQSEKMSALGNLVAGVAHEINNPVAFLNGNINPALDYIKDIFRLVDLYQQEYPQPSLVIQDEIAAIDLEFIRDDLPKLVGSMREGVKRIRDISTSLRTFSRADRDYPVPCNIHNGIDSTILILKHRLKGNESRPEIQVIKNYGVLPQVECFAGQLNQVFMNLLANAIDALEESNVGRSFAEIQALPNLIIVTTELSLDRQTAVIRIQDNGVGMTDEVKQKIFEHLFTTKGVGSGTGLGLAIAKSIVVEKHAGTLLVNSTLNQGAEFVISIPVKATVLPLI